MKYIDQSTSKWNERGDQNRKDNTDEIIFALLVNTMPHNPTKERNAIFQLKVKFFFVLILTRFTTFIYYE